MFEYALCRIGVVDGSTKVTEVFEVATHDAVGNDEASWLKGEDTLDEDCDVLAQLLREKVDAEDDAVKPPWTKHALSLLGLWNHRVRRQ
jgi:hypothetical protein